MTSDRVARQEIGRSKRSIRKLVEGMLDGIDRDSAADHIGVIRPTFDDKVRHGRFRADELWRLAAYCGYSMTSTRVDGAGMAGNMNVGDGDRTTMAMASAPVETVELGYSKGKWTVTASKNGKRYGLTCGKLSNACVALDRILEKEFK